VPSQHLLHLHPRLSLHHNLTNPTPTLALHPPTLNNRRRDHKLPSKLANPVLLSHPAFQEMIETRAENVRVGEEHDIGHGPVGAEVNGVKGLTS